MTFYQQVVCPQIDVFCVLLDDLRKKWVWGSSGLRRQAAKISPSPRPESDLSTVSTSKTVLGPTLSRGLKDP